MYRNVQLSWNSPGEGSLGSWRRSWPCKRKANDWTGTSCDCQRWASGGDRPRQVGDCFQQENTRVSLLGPGVGDRRPGKDTLLEIGAGGRREGAPRGSARATGWAMNSDTGKKKKMVCRAGWTEVCSLTLGCRAFSGKRSPTRGDVSADSASSRPRGKQRQRHGTKKLGIQASPSLLKRHLFSLGASSAAGPETLGQCPPAGVPASPCARSSTAGRLPRALRGPRALSPAPAGPGIGCLSQLRFSSGAAVLNLVPSDALPDTKSFPLLPTGLCYFLRSYLLGIRWYSDKLTPAFVFLPL